MRCFRYLSKHTVTVDRLWDYTVVSLPKISLKSVVVINLLLVRHILGCLKPQKMPFDTEMEANSQDSLRLGGSEEATNEICSPSGKLV